MKSQTNYGAMGLAALKRAVSNIAEEARRNGFKVPIWKDGRIVYGFPNVKSTQQHNDDGEKVESHP